VQWTVSRASATRTNGRRPSATRVAPRQHMGTNDRKDHGALESAFKFAVCSKRHPCQSTSEPCALDTPALLAPRPLPQPWPPYMAHTPARSPRQVRPADAVSNGNHARKPPAARRGSLAHITTHSTPDFCARLPHFIRVLGEHPRPRTPIPPGESATPTSPGERTGKSFRPTNLRPNPHRPRHQHLLPPLNPGSTPYRERSDDE
jgi:hypothetical protein